MATAKKTTTKKMKKPAKTKTKMSDKITVAEESRRSTKSKSGGGKGILAIVIGIMILAVVAAATLGEKNQLFEELTTYESDTFSLQYPLNWGFDEGEKQTEFYSDSAAVDSAAGIAVINSGTIPGYEALEDKQKDELLNLALESVEQDSESIQGSFSSVSVSDIRVAKHPAADLALSFELKGTLKDGGEGVLKGFMIITKTGETFVVSAGGNQEVYEANVDTIQSMLQSFRVTDT